MDFLNETLGVGFRHGYWGHQLVLLGLIAARFRLRLMFYRCLLAEFLVFEHGVDDVASVLRS
ncbi:Hypothetical protein CpP54B96_1004 [Corynebacterium pseudotuberculosis P54B96]|nr:Hypothetical protein CpP54B96_1004 [Corynebacterium pseudotuberculosis P54B96]